MQNVPVPNIVPVVDALTELMNAKVELAVATNAKGIVYNAAYRKQVQDLQNKVVAAQVKVTQATQLFQTQLAAALQKP